MEYQYQIMHRKGEKRGNAGSFIRWQYKDCRHYMSIENGDGGSTMLEVCQEIQERTKAQVLRQPVFFELDSRE